MSRFQQCAYCGRDEAKCGCLNQAEPPPQQLAESAGETMDQRPARTRQEVEAERGRLQQEAWIKGKTALSLGAYLALSWVLDDDPESVSLETRLMNASVRQ